MVKVIGLAFFVGLTKPPISRFPHTFWGTSRFGLAGFFVNDLFPNPEPPSRFIPEPARSSLIERWS